MFVRLRPKRGDDDHERDVGDDQHVVGEAHEDRVALAPVEARPEPDRSADQHRHEGGEADDHRDAGAFDDEREHVRAGVVGAEPVSARGRRVDRAGLRVRVVGLDPRAEDGEEDEEDEDREPDDHRRPPEHIGAQAQPPARWDPHEVGDRSPARRGRWEERSCLNHPRVELHVQEVGDEVEEDHREREEEEDRLQHGPVALVDRLDRLEADARVREDVLDRDRAADDEAEREAISVVIGSRALRRPCLRTIAQLEDPSRAPSARSPRRASRAGPSA